MKRFALIVAGGSGNRMKSSVPKQFLLLANQPVLMHTIERFNQFDPETEIVVILPTDQFTYWKELCSKYNFTIQHQLVAGGNIRFESVKNGLNVISTEGIVAIHDGVRPLVSIETIDHCFRVAEIKGNAIPVMPVTESIRFIEGETSQPVDREKYVTIQTPQVFRVSLIKEAYSQPCSDSFTDDATVLQAMGHVINLVEGNPENIKITMPSDLKIVNALFLNNNKIS